MKNNDEQCFKYAILSALFPIDVHPERVTNYTRHLKKLNFTGINFPVEVKQIQKFEALNPDISINVYMFDEKEKKVGILRLTKIVKTHHIHLMLLKKDG